MVTVSHNDCGHECIALSSNRDVSFYGAYPDSSPVGPPRGCVQAGLATQETPNAP